MLRKRLARRLSDELVFAQAVAIRWAIFTIAAVSDFLKETK